MPGQRLTRMMLEAIYFSGGASLARKSLQGVGSILMLHRIGNLIKGGFSPNAHLTISPQFLEKVLQSLSSGNFEFVSMDEAKYRINQSPDDRSRRPFIAVTLDDGYRDNLVHAVPLFRKYQIPYTIYIAPGLVDGTAALWWEDLENIIAKLDTLHLDMPRGKKEFSLKTVAEKNRAFAVLLNYFSSDLSEQEQRRVVKDLCWLHKIDPQAHMKASIMNWTELRDLAKDPLCTLGAHTLGHFAVARLKADEARFEIDQSRRLVELETGQKVKHFAYPYGYPAAASNRDFAIANDLGFETAVTTRHGVCYPQHKDHMMALPRISLNGNFQKMRYVKTLLSGVPTKLANKGKALNVS